MLSLLACGLASSSPPTLPNGRGVVKLAAAAVSRAFADGYHRQTVRIPLSEAIYGDREEGFVADRAIGWQGGPEETYRYLQPLARELLQQVETLPQSETGGLPPRIKEQVLLDFDGSALLTAESAGGGDVQAMLQPNTDGYYLKTIAGVEEQFSDVPGKPRRLFLLLNPAWRDRRSWGFFGGAEAQERILDRYEATFALDQFVLRGQKVSLLRAWPHDWSVYLTTLEGTEPSDDARLDGGGQARLLATFAERPEYKVLDELCTDVLRGRRV